MAERIKAPRGTFDVLPERRGCAPRSTPPRRRSSSAPATAGSRRRSSRTPGCSSAGSAKRPTSSARRCSRFDDQGGRSAHPAARGHGADLPRLHRARHAHASAAGEALVRGSVLPLRAPAGGPLSPVQPDRGRGDRLRGSALVDAELIILLDEILADLGIPRAAAAARLPRLAATRAAYRDELRDYLRDHDDDLSDEVRDADRPQPDARLRLRPRRRRRR